MQSDKLNLARTNKQRIRAYSFLAILLLSILGFALSNIKLNVTKSYPLGFWRIHKSENIKKGDYVVICPTKEISEIALERHYLATGNCPSGTMPLLKKIAATHGDTVVVTNTGISINGILIPNTKPRTVDSEERPMQLALGDTVAADMVWVVSNYSDTSYDSRYFGALPRSNIQGVAEPVWTW